MVKFSQTYDSVRRNCLLSGSRLYRSDFTGANTAAINFVTKNWPYSNAVLFVDGKTDVSCNAITNVGGGPYKFGVDSCSKTTIALCEFSNVALGLAEVEVIISEEAAVTAI